MQKKLWALAVALSALAVTAGCSTQTQTAEESEVVADNGRNGKKVTAVVELLARFDEESNIKDWRFDETAQALAHASGCFIAIEDREVYAQKISPVEGRMSIRDAVAQALKGTAFEIKEATNDHIVVGRKK